MGYYVNKEDFIGKVAIGQGMYNASKIDDYIQKYELKYLVELFGVDMYEEYKSNADLDTVNHIPSEPLLATLYNPFIYQEWKEILISGGIKEMLLYFIYFEYMKDDVSETSLNGMVVQEGENSRMSHSMLYTRYNEGVKTFNAIQDYICLNSSGYPKFRSNNKEYVYWL